MSSTNVQVLCQKYSLKDTAFMANTRLSPKSLLNHGAGAGLVIGGEADDGAGGRMVAEVILQEVVTGGSGRN